MLGSVLAIFTKIAANEIAIIEIVKKIGIGGLVLFIIMHPSIFLKDKYSKNFNLIKNYT
jgi:hypothetical protein